MGRAASLPLRAPTSADFPRELHPDPDRYTHGMPWLHGELNQDAPRRRTIALRIHNHAGIPIIEGRAAVEAGRRDFTFTHLQVLGIDAYAHVSEAERVKITLRVWSRGAYGKLSIDNTAEGSA